MYDSPLSISPLLLTAIWKTQSSMYSFHLLENFHM